MNRASSADEDVRVFGRREIILLRRSTDSRENGEEGR